MKAKRLFSLLMAVVVMMSMFCSFGTTASAISGSGTENDPYLISNAEEFELIQDFPSASFRLTGHIVLNKKYTSTCGFSGTLDGNGYLVVGIKGVSPFINYGTIKNLFVQLGDMSSALIYENSGIIENSGILDGEVSAYGQYGGTLVRTNKGTIKNCFSTTQLTVTGAYGTSENSCIGGFAGYNVGTIENCYYAGHVYCKGTHTNGGDLKSYVSPFVGKNKEASSEYLDDGGKVASCFYDQEEARGTYGAGKASGGASGKSPAAMKMLATYAGWNFDNVWAMDSSKNNGYPYLQIEKRFGSNSSSETTGNETEINDENNTDGETETGNNETETGSETEVGDEKNTDNRTETGNNETEIGNNETEIGSETKTGSTSKSKSGGTVKISKTSVKVYNSETCELSVKGGSGTVRWKSSNKKVASVSSSGKVNGRKAGKCVITAIRNGKKVKCKVTVPGQYKENKCVPDFGALYGYQQSDRKVSDSAAAFEYTLSGSSLSKFNKKLDSYKNKLVRTGFKLDTFQFDEDKVEYVYINTSKNTLVQIWSDSGSRRILIGFKR
ncbi:MAG: Ig-like domain-containing protein [Lachnospiraceae bacterium]